MKKVISRLAIVAVGLLALAPSSQAAEYTLRLAHMWPAQAAMGKIWPVWGESIEKASHGRIKVEIYPSQTLAKGAKTYGAVVSGIADIGVAVQGYTANRFPLSQVVELPGVSGSGVQGSCIAQTLLQEGDIASEYADVHPLLVFTHGPGMIHTKGKAVRTPEDLNGLRIRRPTALIADTLTALGGQPVGMPAPEIYQAMSRGVIDGATLPWEATKSFRLNELADQHTEINLYTLIFVVAMNKTVYEGMPADLRKVIDAHSDMEWATRVGRVMDEQDKTGRAQAVAQNHSIITIEGGVNNPAWKGVLDLATESYLANNGATVRGVYARIQSISPTCAGFSADSLADK